MDPVTANGNNTPDDDAPNRRPRDVRLIHSLLGSQGVTSYQERVPLMLIDFAYRYTRSVLADAASLDAEGYGPETRGRGANKEEGVTMTSLRLAVASRQAAQVQPKLGKADLQEMGLETNRIGLPRVEREFGVRLPDERFVLTGNEFLLKDEWMEEEEDDEIEGEDETEKPDEAMPDQPEDEDDGIGLDDEEMDDDQFEEVMGVQQDKKMTDA
jgi:transcription initiation factor TFIID subunit 9B